MGKTLRELSREAYDRLVSGEIYPGAVADELTWKEPRGVHEDRGYIGGSSSQQLEMVNLRTRVDQLEKEMTDMRRIFKLLHVTED